MNMYLTRPLKILIILPSDGHGGCEYNALSFAKYMSIHYNAKVLVSVAMAPPTEYVLDLCARNNLDVIPFDGQFEKSDTEEQVEKHRQLTAKLVREQKPDACFVPLPWPKRGQGVILGCADVGVPSLIKFALVPPEIDQASYFVHPELRKIPERQLWFANSRFSAALLEGQWKLPRKSVDSFHVGPIGLRHLLERPSTSVGNNVPLRVAFNIPPDAVVAITVGRLVAQKGYDIYLQAANELLVRFNNLWLVWVGDGELRSKIEQWKIQNPHVANRLILTGFREDVPALLKESNLFVFPTRYEGGCSQALLEAFEASLPVAVSNTSAIPEVVTNEVNGLLFANGSSASITEAVGRLLEDQNLRMRLTIGAAKTADIYTAERMFEETVNRFRILLGSNFESTGDSTRWDLPVQVASRSSANADETIPFVSGWYPPEKTAWGRNYRWTTSSALVMLRAAIRDDDEIYIRGVGDPPDEVLSSVTVSLNGELLGGGGPIKLKKGRWVFRTTVPETSVRPMSIALVAISVAQTTKRKYRGKVCELGVAVSEVSIRTPVNDTLAVEAPVLVSFQTGSLRVPEK